ncbi:MAG: serine/threonine protein kinase [Planctomycetes bacterium]|nr:serine/threonine protein kinase [Planctomycetota bacterium]
MTPELERAAVQHALAQGWLAPARLREALLLREHLRATGRPAELVPLLAARFLRPEHARDLERRLLGASTPVALAPPPPVTAPDLERSVDLAARPADQDPAPVRQFLSSLPGLAAMARDATVSLVTPGRGPAPAPVLPQAVPRTLGPYEVVRELARGGMGAVYVARHPRLDRQVALKILLGLDPARLKRFEIEARATAKLRHPNIVPIHEVGEEGATRYLVMDLIEGESLKDRIERLGPLDPVEAARMTEKVARALDYAHRRGVLHRDMKPSNVLVDLEGEPLITDFGLAKEVEGEERLTVTGQLIGTPVYMPPEQATGARGRIDARSDVYSLGATFYEMLTGGPPFQGDHLMNIVVAVVRDAPAPPSKARPGLDPALEAICLRCLAKDPAARYESAGALAEALGAWLRARRAPAADARAGPPPRRRWPRRRSLALAALALAGVMARPGADPRRAPATRRAPWRRWRAAPKGAHPAGGRARGARARSPTTSSSSWPRVALARAACAASASTAGRAPARARGPRPARRRRRSAAWPGAVGRRGPARLRGG